MSTTGTERGQRGVNRVLLKLDNSIESGNYYEAHQMYRTLYFRYTSQRKYEECLYLLYNGSLKLAEKRQESSAADLGLLLVETLERCNSNLDSGWDWEMWIERLCKLIGILKPTTVERETLINRAVKWSGDMSGNSLGHPTLHKNIAQICWSEGNIDQARHHYLLCRDGKICGRVLIKIQCCKGYYNEIDLFIIQAVLQQLCLKERKCAEETFMAYTINHPQIRQRTIPFEQPLLNFIYFVFRLIDLGNLNAFNTLCALYKPSLKRDSSFEKYLAKIGIIYLGARPPPAGGGVMGGMMGDFFSRLFQGFEEDETAEHAQQSMRNGRGDGNDLD